MSRIPLQLAGFYLSFWDQRATVKSFAGLFGPSLSAKLGMGRFVFYQSLTHRASGADTVCSPVDKCYFFTPPSMRYSV